MLPYSHKMALHVNPSFLYLVSPHRSSSPLTTSLSSFMMKFFTAIATVLATCSAATAYTLSYDPVYDVSSTSLSVVACAGVLQSHGYTTFGSLPTFPNIGGAPQITGWGSAYCGTCWNITYTNPSNPWVTTSVIATAIDVGDPAREGYNLSQETMDALTCGKAVQLGRVTVTATQLSRSACGLNW
jgi:hypothetical protein